MSRLEYEKLGIGVNVKDKGLRGDGVTNDAVALNALIASIGSSPADIVFPSGTFKIGTNVTQPSNIRFIMSNGAVFSGVVGTETLTLNGEFEAGIYQVFTNIIVTGKTKIEEAYPEWFGAIANQIFDCTNAINDCLTAFKTCRLSKGYYKITSTINILKNYKLTGNNSDVSDGGVTSFLYVAFSGTAISVIAWYYELKDFTISPAVANKWLYTGVCFGNVSNEISSQGKVDNVTCVYALIAFEGQECYCTRFSRLRTYQCKTSMLICEGFNGNDIHIDQFTYGYKVVTVGNIGIHVTGGSINKFYSGEISGMEHAIYYDSVQPNKFADIWMEWNTYDLYNNIATGTIDFQCSAVSIGGNTKGVRSSAGMGKSYQRTMIPDSAMNISKELKGYYIFDSIVSGFDYSYNNNNINVNNLTPTLVDGIYGKAWNIASQTVNHYASIPNTTLDITKPITMVINLKFNAIQASYPELLQILDGSKYLRIRSNVTQYPAVSLYTYNGTAVSYATKMTVNSTAVPMRTTDQTIIITIDIPNNKIYTYNYGYQEQEEVFTLDHITKIDSIRLFLDKVGSDHNMKVNWLMLYNRKLESNEIEYLRNQQILSIPIDMLTKSNDRNEYTISLINKTGAASVKGSLVSASTTTDNAFALQNNEFDTIGIVYESGVADGSSCKIIVSGIAEVLLKDNTSATRGYWVIAADTDGRADATQPTPTPNNTTSEHTIHFKEIGHCLESKVAGTNVLAKCLIHFN